MTEILRSIMETWIGQLCIILLGYGTIIVPGYFLIRYFKNSQYIDRANNGLLSKLIVSCVYGRLYDTIVPPDDTSRASSKRERTATSTFFQLSFCFLGLQVSYLTWGVLQEKIMTKEYSGFNHEVGQFKDSQFLVFVNRILAFIISLVYINVIQQPRHTAPLYKYSYCSFSNIMSSWCQYEALKYVSFPTQVLAKASKIIPTMIMGKIVSKKTYEYYEYVTALMISIGMTLFLLSTSDDHGKSATSTTISGLIILVGYMTFDSFTSNWQGELFNVYKMSSVQMMCGVNLFSCLFTLVSLLQQGVFSKCIEFMFLYPAFFWDCLVLSICSASGQLFIYYTISCFGPIIFVLIMTIRQGLAIVISCILYGHPVSLSGTVGIIIVFTALFLRIYCGFRTKQLKQAKATIVDPVKA